MKNKDVEYLQQNNKHFSLFATTTNKPEIRSLHRPIKHTMTPQIAKPKFTKSKSEFIVRKKVASASLNDEIGNNNNSGLFRGRPSRTGSDVLDRFVPSRKESNSNALSNWEMEKSKIENKNEFDVSPTTQIFGDKPPITATTTEEQTQWTQKRDAHREYTKIIKGELFGEISPPKLSPSDYFGNGNGNSNGNRNGNGKENVQISPSNEIQVALESVKLSSKHQQKHYDYGYSSNNSTKYYTGASTGSDFNKYKFKRLTPNDSDASTVCASSSSNDSQIVRLSQRLQYQQEIAHTTKSQLKKRVLAFSTPHNLSSTAVSSIPMAIPNKKAQTTFARTGRPAQTQTQAQAAGARRANGRGRRKSMTDLSNYSWNANANSNENNNTKGVSFDFKFKTKQKDETSGIIEDWRQFQINPVTMSTQSKICKSGTKLKQKKLSATNVCQDRIEPFKTFEVGNVVNDFYTSLIDWNFQTNVIAYGDTSVVSLYNVNSNTDDQVCDLDMRYAGDSYRYFANSARREEFRHNRRLQQRGGFRYRSQQIQIDPRPTALKFSPSVKLTFYLSLHGFFLFCFCIVCQFRLSLRCFFFFF